MIALRSVSKEMGRGSLRKLVLDQIDWVFPRRSRTIVLGQSGAGKSTLVSMLAGSSLPSRGHVERRESVSFGRLPKAGGPLTVRQQITHMARLYDVDPEQAVRFVREFAEIEKFLDIPVAYLPRQARATMAIALVYAIPFDFYVFDNSVAVRKGPIRERCFEAYKWRSKEAGVILATSNVREALNFDGSAAILYNGKLIGFDSVDEAVRVFSSLPPPAPANIVVADDELVEPAEDDSLF